MIQDIFPHRLDISFALPEQQTDDFVLCFQGRKIALREDGSYPRRRELPPLAESQYLFSIDGEHYFLGRCEQEELPGELSWQSTRRLRGMKPMEQALAGFTAQHLWTWYESNRFCGKCGHPMELGRDERKVCCPHCGNAVYPRINPAVIAAVTDGDRLLMTRYADRPVTWFVLVAGFVEIGEAAEETVRRVEEIAVEREGEMVVIRIRGNGFLYNMVRIIAGTLMKVGMGVYPPEYVEEILEARDREKAGPKVPARGLTLVSLDYEETLRPVIEGRNRHYAYRLEQGAVETAGEASLWIERAEEEEFAPLVRRTVHQAFRNGAVRVILEDAGGRLREGQQYGFYRIEAREENGIRQMVAVYDPAEGCDE